MADKDEVWDEILPLARKHEFYGLDEKSFRVHFSFNHMLSAGTLAERAKTLEDKYSGTRDVPKSKFYHIQFHHQSCVVSSLLSSFFFVEAVANEFYEDIVRSPHRYDLSDDFVNIVHIIDREARRSFTHKSPIEKYHWLLEAAQKKPFNKEQQLYENTKILKKLRDYFVHYFPEDIEFGEDIDRVDVTKAFGATLESKVEMNPLSGKNQPLFPNRVLSHDCAAWGIKSALQFTDEFYSRFGETHRYDHIRGVTESEYIQSVYDHES